jgi:hypothetical protein
MYFWKRRLTMMIPEIVSFKMNRIHLDRHLEYMNEEDYQIKIIHKFNVANSRFGKGCFANATIEKDETICFLEGKETSWEEFEKKYRGSFVRVDDPLQISETKYLELHKPYIYFNHSCNPNSGLRGRNQLIAIKKIMPDEEINYDYSSVSWDDRLTKDYGEWTMKCECEEKNCRKVIGNFPTIPKSQRMKYIRLKVVPNFILEKLAREKEKCHQSLNTKRE